MQAVSFSRIPSRMATAVLALLFLFPLLWSALASVSPQAGTHQANGFGVGNYVRLLEYGHGALVYVLNSTIVSLLTVGLTLALSVMGGYAFARFTFPGRNALFVLTLGILMIPYGTMLIPLYVLLHAMGLLDSLLGL